MKIYRKKTVSFLIVLMILQVFALPISSAKSADNLLVGGSFERNISDNWGFWQSPSSNREYDFYRAYDAPFGFGSYSAAIDAGGGAENAFNAILSSLSGRSFNVLANENYYLMFYAKATTNMSLISYLQRADNYDAITAYQGRDIGINWEKHIINISPTASVAANLAFVLGDMPDGSSLYLDGVQLVKDDLRLNTGTISGTIGATNKFLQINNIANFSLSEIEIELPYYNNLNNQIEHTRIRADRMNNRGVYFTFPERTFSGIGRVFTNDILSGEFNYRINMTISGIHPETIRLNQDLIIYCEGFSPITDTTFLIADSINSEGQSDKAWISPESFDSGLSQLRFVMPAGIRSGKLYLQSTFINTNGDEVSVKSNNISYKLKPMIVATNWRQRGYEHVGDSLLIYGLGFGRTPAVVFYDNNGERLETKEAKIVEVSDVEVVEVKTTRKTNSFNITVKSGGIESDRSDSLEFLAKPLLDKITAKKKRKHLSSNEMMPAAKIGETITLNGHGFLSENGETNVEFEGLVGRITVAISEEAILNGGKTIKVEVPSGVVNGYLGINSNGIDSNFLPLEIMPTIISISPDPIVPGEMMTIRANGVGTDVNLAKIEFKSSKNSSYSINPEAIDIANNAVEIRLRAPYSVSNSSSKITLSYDRWSDNGQEKVNIHPHIIRAGINMDNKVLSIIGYGFSLVPNENIVTYSYADENHTVIVPKAKIMGVYKTDEGQEIRIKILDDYYFGHVSLTVGDYQSNEVNFGPITVSRIARRAQYVESSGAVMGVLYISGYNFGSGGGVRVADRWAEVHYRSDTFIIAVVPQANLYDNPVLVARE